MTKQKDFPQEKFLAECAECVESLKKIELFSDAPHGHSFNEHFVPNNERLIHAGIERAALNLDPKSGYFSPGAALFDLSLVAEMLKDADGFSLTDAYLDDVKSKYDDVRSILKGHSGAVYERIASFLPQEVRKTAEALSLSGAKIEKALFHIQKMQSVDWLGEPLQHQEGFCFFKLEKFPDERPSSRLVGVHQELVDTFLKPRIRQGLRSSALAMAPINVLSSLKRLIEILQGIEKRHPGFIPGPSIEGITADEWPGIDELRHNFAENDYSFGGLIRSHMLFPLTSAWESLAGEASEEWRSRIDDSKGAIADAVRLVENFGRGSR